MKIENAYICENCQQVTETDGHGYCAVCGSSALFDLAKIADCNSEEEVLSLSPSLSDRITEEDVLVGVSSGNPNRLHTS